MTIVSEFYPSKPWSVYAAMQRNATICALSDALVVVEAQAKGGTLNAGIECLRQKKPLLVIEYGRPDDMPDGNRELIQKGGIPVSTFKELVLRLNTIIGRREPIQESIVKQLAFGQ